MSNNKDIVVGMAMGFGVGLIMGGALGILFAPKSGKETRKLIRDKSGKFVEEAKQFPADVRAKFNKCTVDDIKKR
jgi:gas vesicle protein